MHNSSLFFLLPSLAKPHPNPHVLRASFARFLSRRSFILLGVVKEGLSRLIYYFLAAITAKGRC